MTNIPYLRHINKRTTALRDTNNMNVRILRGAFDVVEYNFKEIERYLRR